ncbi:MAG TPA: hypothetical protein HA276_07150 [Candidatus Poseidoniaceae archaeon]|nr:MAG: hypothetical protein CBD01_002275 [Euryarchaeota archaeon TMED141]DAC08724.1 MAG TPA: hypothetical protein D7I09_07285 [Candidatus Poseidoniales archaeon]DAC15686.1 MAG TPA: hypothetical protein D7I01_07035 [Candidatus Poseidoniales archaeon]HII19114.1 hypothetical protein [Candidatus Poseidoniaceae archaeon]HII97452.1 hypothetical protein [Candidatus Poseidoniaceae archaeon]
MARTPTALLMLALLLCAPLVSAVDARDADVIDADQTLTEDTAFDDGFTVTNGATMTVDANITLGDDAVVRIDEGATLNLVGGHMIGSDIQAYMALAGGASTIELPVQGMTGTATVRLMMSKTLNGSELLNVTASTGERVNEATGDDVSLQVNLGDGVDVLTLDLTHNHPFPFGPVAVEVVDSSAQQQRHEAWDLAGTNLVLTWGDAAFSIDVQGTLTIADAMVRGADLRCSGTCSIERSTMEGSAPIIAEAGASLSVRSSMILGSRTDEDVVAVDDADLVYEDSTGTGGWTDAWIRRLSARTVTTNMPGALVSGADLGYKGTKSPNAFADTLGDGVGVELGNSEMTRIVEWVTGDGIYGKEEGTFTVTATTGWGTFTTTVPAVWAPITNVDLQLPVIEVVAIEVQDRTATVNESLGVMLTVANSGTADAPSPVLECTVGGEAADTSPSYIQLSTYGGLAAGSQMEIPLTWRMPSDGAHVLACGVIDLSGTPLEAVEDMVTSDTGVTGAEVSWTYAEEVEEAPWVTVLIALTVFLLGVAGIARVAGARANVEDEEDEEAASSPEDDVKQYPETVVDAPSEEATEEEPSDVEATSGEDEEATEVAPWDEA